METTKEKTVMCKQCGETFTGQGHLMSHARHAHPIKKADIAAVEKFLDNYESGKLGELDRALRECMDLEVLKSRIGISALKTRIHKARKRRKDHERDAGRSGLDQEEHGNDTFCLTVDDPFAGNAEEPEVQVEVHVVEVPVEKPVDIHALLSRIPAAELLYLTFERVTSQMDRIERSLKLLGEQRRAFLFRI